MNWKQRVDRFAGRWLRAALPPRCLLCGEEGANGRDLCAACTADLPRNDVCCGRCALPLAHPAPLCGHCLRREPPFATAWAAFRYAHPLDLLEARFKFHGDLAAGRVLAELMIERARLHFTAPGRDPVDPGAVSARRLPGLLLCVPLHDERLRERGYNQAIELAKPLAQAIGIAFDAHAILRVRNTSAQTGLDARARRKNVRDAFTLRPGTKLPVHVAVLDDVMTTGTTLRECAITLKRAGVERVDAWALARAPGRHSVA